MELFRLTRAKYGVNINGLGKGASKKGARWNSGGNEIIYTASNRSLAMAEVVVHFSLATLPDDYLMLTFYVPDGCSIQTVPENHLPLNWNQFPHSRDTQLFGDRFLNSNEYCILKVPSVVTKGDYNYLLNPKHPEFKSIKIIHKEPFPFDQRIFKSG